MSKFSLNVNETDDDFFGTLESRSNLANLFDVQQQSDDGNQTLKYKPPKEVQRSPDGTTSSDGTAWSVQVAKVVSAYKLVNQENVSQGRVGLALLRNTQNQLKVIAYRSKSNVLATITLRDGVKLTLKSSYLQFHDDTRDFWSIFLETSDEKAFVDQLPPEYVLNIEESSVPKPPLEEKTSSKSERLSEDSDDTAKATLLSRMARMGQPLPMIATPQTTTDLSDSSDTEVINIPPKPSIVPRKITKQIIPVSSSIQPASVVTYASQVQDNQYMNMLLTENRTQNTEIRMNLSKLETKIERVLDKIDLIGVREPAQAEKRDKDDEILNLEEKILELRKENRSLRQNCRELELKKTAPEARKAKVKAGMFSGFESVLRDMEIETSDGMDLEDVAKDILERASIRIGELKTKCEAKEKQLTDYGAETADLKKKIEELESRLESLDRLNQDLKDDLVAEKTNSNQKLEVVVKQIMNNLYSDIATALVSSDQSLTTETVLRICGSAIRKETINAIQENSK